MNLEIKETTKLDRITELAKSFGTAVHALEHTEKAWNAIVGGKFVGGMILEKKSGAYQISVTTVAKEYQLQSIGTKFVKVVDDYVKNDGGGIIYVVTRKAAGFYEKCGYEATDTIPSTILRCLTCPKYEECNPTFLKKEIKVE